MIDAEHMSLDEMVKLALKSKDSGVLDELANSDCLNAMIFVARNKHTSKATLEKLASKCHSQTLCEALLGNTKLDKSIKKMLAS